MDDLLVEFLTETAENLAQVDLQLIELERNPGDSAVLAGIFRLVHTIKGTSGFLGLPRLEAVAHAGESVLGRFRDGELAATPAAITLVLRCMDSIRQLLRGLEQTGAEPAGDDRPLIEALTALAAGEDGPMPGERDGSAMTGEGGGEPVVGEGGFPVAADLLAEVEPLEAAAGIGTPAGGDGPPQSPEPAAPEPVAAGSPEPAEATVAGQSIRVHVDTLETLINLVGELVLCRNQFLQMARARRSCDFAVPLQRLSRITTDLQQGVMKTRMQPIGSAWAKLPRIVRDLARETGKQIQLCLYGGETELDRQVLELIRDPLTHMVRNSADHGIEDPQVRRLAGKPETGTISVRAFHAGGQIHIVIADDGKGLDTVRIRAQALKKGLASQSELTAMSQSQIQQFVFSPGFSTAENVTAVSGRGVGMDVVKTNIEKIGGTIEMTSAPGAGTRFTIRIPLTLAIVSVLMVGCNGQRFALPKSSIVEVVRTRDGSAAYIDWIRCLPVLHLRNRLLPLVELQRMFGAGGEPHGGDRFVIVTHAGDHTFGILVDDVADTEEIVVKPLPPLLGEIPLYSGSTILGDGNVVTVLDPAGIAGSIAADWGRQSPLAEIPPEVNEESEPLLLFRAGDGGLQAVPLDLVSRLEVIDRSAIEHGAGRAMVRYGGRLMPLVPCDPGHRWSSEGRQPVVVFADRERTMGLVVDRFVDIVEARVRVDIRDPGQGRIGSAIVADSAAGLIDVEHFFAVAFGDGFDSRFAGTTVAGTRWRVLLVDGDALFRGLLRPKLEAAGFQVTAVRDPLRALALREAGRQFDAIVSETEMAGMDGFRFAEEVRRDGRWAGLPMIALSAHTGEADFQRGREAGFTDYLGKPDRDELPAVLRTCLGGAEHP
jgi:two-component system chemotaxis sensor kinase CheA